MIEDFQEKITEMDKKTCDSTAQLIKAAMPYTNAAMARMLAVAAKMLELKKALACVQNPEPELNICALPGQRPEPEEMLRDLRKYCEPAQAEMIDKMLGVLNMGKFYEKYKELENSPEFPKMMNMMKNVMNSMPSSHDNPMPQMHQQFGSAPTIESLKQMLSPEQQQMFEMLSNWQKNQ